jgi:hypothetical protein
MALLGCSKDGPKIVPINGVVTYQGQPVPNLTIHFIPDSGRPSWGRTDAQGRFKLSYDPENDGAVVGRHRIWVQFRPGSPAEEDTFEKVLAMLPKERKAMLDKYGNSTDPQYEVEIKSDTRDLEIKLE